MKKQSMRSLLLFDMDGVLLDSASAIISSVEAALIENGLSVPERAVIQQHIGPPLKAMFSGILGEVDSSLIDACTSSYRRHNDEFGPAETQVFPHASESLIRLYGRVHLRVATSKAEPSARSVMHHTGLARFFDDIHGTLNPLTDTKVHVLRRAIDSHRQIDAAVRIVAMIGDREHDIHAARELGVASIAAMWGYALEGEISAASPNFRAHSAEELIDIVEYLVAKPD